jgi:hypothetical protein
MFENVEVVGEAGSSECPPAPLFSKQNQAESIAGSGQQQPAGGAGRRESECLTMGIDRFMKKYNQNRTESIAGSILQHPPAADSRGAAGGQTGGIGMPDGGDGEIFREIHAELHRIHTRQQKAAAGSSRQQPAAGGHHPLCTSSNQSDASDEAGFVDGRVREYVASYGSPPSRCDR